MQILGGQQISFQKNFHNRFLYPKNFFLRNSWNKNSSAKNWKVLSSDNVN